MGVYTPWLSRRASLHTARCVRASAAVRRARARTHQVGQALERLEARRRVDARPHAAQLREQARGVALRCGPYCGDGRGVAHGVDAGDDEHPRFVAQGRSGELEGRVWVEEGVVDELVWGVG